MCVRVCVRVSVCVFECVYDLNQLFSQLTPLLSLPPSLPPALSLSLSLTNTHIQTVRRMKLEHSNSKMTKSSSPQEKQKNTNQPSHDSDEANAKLPGDLCVRP